MIRDIVLQDLGIEKVPVIAFSSRGSPYTRWILVGMPKISESILDCVFFLYENAEDARARVNPKGTGFIVSYGYGTWWSSYVYGVTARHVITSTPGAPVISINTVDGDAEIFDFDVSNWETQRPGEDIALIPLNLNRDRHKISSVDINLFATQNDIKIGKIGVGDDVFMLGLFVDHQGHTTQVPKARFGNISMISNPDAPIIHPDDGYKSISHVIDMHSRSGFSGSPVFMYRTIGSDLTNRESGLGKVKIESLMHAVAFGTIGGPTFSGKPIEIQLYEAPVFKFLGIHWGQFPEHYELEIETESTKKQSIKGMSGMTSVCPSWKILEMLDMPKLKKQREEKLANDKIKHAGEPILESEKSYDSRSNPNHKRDFNHLLDAAVTGKKSGG